MPRIVIAFNDSFMSRTTTFYESCLVTAEQIFNSLSITSLYAKKKQLCQSAFIVTNKLFIHLVKLHSTNQKFLRSAL